MKKIWPIVVLVALPGLYLCLDLFDTAQILRQLFIMPVYFLAYVLHQLVGFNVDGPLLGMLDVDVEGLAPALLRTSVFAVFTAALMSPFWLWSRTRKRKHLVISLVILAVVLLASIGFMVSIVSSMWGMTD